MRDAIQRVAIEMPAYGYRRVTAALVKEGWAVNRKRVLRIMREDNGARDLAESVLVYARRQIRRFIEGVYNRKRLHSALGYNSPIEFEWGLAQSEWPVFAT